MRAAFDAVAAGSSRIDDGELEAMIAAEDRHAQSAPPSSVLLLLSDRRRRVSGAPGSPAMLHFLCASDGISTWAILNIYLIVFHVAWVAKGLPVKREDNLVSEPAVVEGVQVDELNVGQSLVPLGNVPAALAAVQAAGKV